MKTFDELKLLYEQLFNTHNEISAYLDKGWDNEAMQKTSHFQRIASQIKLAQTGITPTKDEEIEIENLNQKAMDITTSLMNKMIGMQAEIKNELQRTKNTLKISNAYSTDSSISGQLIDEVE